MFMDLRRDYSKLTWKTNKDAIVIVDFEARIEVSHGVALLELLCAWFLVHCMVDAPLI